MATIQTNPELFDPVSGEPVARRDRRDVRDDTVPVPAGPQPQTFAERNVEVDNTWDDPTRRAPLVNNHKNFRDVTDTVTDFNLKGPDWPWIILFLTAGGVTTMFLGGTILYLLITGPGVWGNNNTVAWGWPIVNFVFWVGIGHAGTLISAILFLLRQDWRTSINRFAEAMTIFAVGCAGIYPGLHVGRPWLAYWLFPYPNQMAMWPQFRSPLMWDVFAVSTYASVSMLFWYVGMVPDLATLRDRCRNKIGQAIYGALSLGWTGSSRHWWRFEKMYLLLAALATPLVLSVHSVVSFDFAVSQLPGWHTTIFPPYFVAGAVFGGFAMVLTLAIPAREWFGLKGLITMRHIDNMCKIMLATGLIVAYAYVTEFFIAWYSGVTYEQFAFMNRPVGNYMWAFWTMIACNVVFPQLLWVPRFRRNFFMVMFCAMCVNIGMWFERFVIIITSLTRDFLPSSWADFAPTWVDVAMFFGTFGFFLSNMLLFIKFGPIIAMAEVKTVMPQAHVGHGKHDQAQHHESHDYRPARTDPEKAVG
jgi:molybdopterin-containing oxidoreductase family membrane subunit